MGMTNNVTLRKFFTDPFFTDRASFYLIYQGLIVLYYIILFWRIGMAEDIKENEEKNELPDFTFNREKDDFIFFDSIKSG